MTMRPGKVMDWFYVNNPGVIGFFTIVHIAAIEVRDIISQIFLKHIYIQFYFIYLSKL